MTTNREAAISRLLTGLTAVIALLVVMCADNGGKRQTPGQVVELLPEQAGVWQQAAEVRLFDRQTIFDYIDGAGEVYRQYGFRECAVAEYQAPGQPQITVEVFDMGSSRDAYGIMSHVREGSEAGYGQGSQQVGSVLHFWQDRYFISIYPERRSVATDAAVSEFAAKIVAAIGRDGDKPGLLNLLPGAGLQQQSIRYFHLHPSLNYHYYLAAQNILLLNESTEAILAAYDSGKTKLLLIQYPQETEAEEALTSFLSSYLPEAKEEGLAETAPGKWVFAAVSGQLLVITFDAASAEMARALAAAVTSKKEQAQP